MIAGLQREIPEAKFANPSGGYFMWVELPEGFDVTELESAARERGVLFVKGTDFLLEGGVFTPDLIETWIDYKRTNEIDPIRLRPHPHEFELYYDI